MPRVGCRTSLRVLRFSNICDLPGPSQLAATYSALWLAEMALIRVKYLSVRGRISTVRDQDRLFAHLSAKWKISTMETEECRLEHLVRSIGDQLLTGIDRERLQPLLNGAARI